MSGSIKRYLCGCNGEEYKISIVDDFSKYPGGRYASQSPYSGEAFRAIVAKALRENDQVHVDLTGVLGYGTAFLDEAFGCLVEKEGIGPVELRRRLSLLTTMESDEMRIWGLIEGFPRRQC